jgi:hypothetical protein
LLSAALVAAGTALTAAAADAPVDAASSAVNSGGRTAHQVAGRDTTEVRTRTQTQRTASPLDRRVELLARELNLDATQQLKVRALLESQREQVRSIWDDEAVPGALRVKRTQAISAGTEDSIRALLTADQKQRYSKSRPAGGDADGNPSELATWMDKVNGR